MPIDIPEEPLVGATGAGDSAAIIAAFLDRYADCSIHTKRAFSREVRRFAIWHAATYSFVEGGLAQVSRDDINRYMSEFAEGRISLSAAILSELGVNPARPPFISGFIPKLNTLRQTKLCLGLFFAFMVEDGHILRNPVRAARRVRKHATQNLGQQKALTLDEWELIVDALDFLPDSSPAERASQARTRWVLQLLYRACLRREEAALLRMADFKNEGGHWELEVMGKGRKLARIIATSRLIAELKRYREGIGLPPLPAFGEDGPAIRSLSGTDAIGPDTIYNICKQHFIFAATLTEDAQTRSRLYAAAPHWLRHTGITHALEAGIPPRRVQAQARHSSLATTGIYDHQAKTAWAEDMERMTT